MLLAGLVLLAVSLVNYRYQSLALQDIEATLQVQKQATQEKTDLSGEVEDVAMASARRQLALNWEPLFASVEAADTPEVALMSLGPDPTGGTVRLALEAKNNAAMLEYVEGLGRQPGMRNVSLVSQETLIEHPQLPVRFTVEASWQ